MKNKSRIKSFFEPVIGLIRRFLLFIVTFILLVIVGLGYYASRDRQPKSDNLIEEIPSQKEGEMWQETHKGVVTLKFADTLIIDIFSEDNVVSYACSYSEKTTITNSQSQEVKISEVEEGDEVEVMMNIQQLEQDAQMRECENITLLTKDVLDEGYIQN